MRSMISGVLLVLFASSCFAGGFNVPVIGGRMSARTAFTAVADDTTAIYHNPAGLSQIDGYRIDLSATGVYSHTVYQLGSYETDTNGQGYLDWSDPIYLERPFGFLPYFGFSGDFGLEDLTFGFGLYSPNNAATSLAPTSPANFQLIEGSIITLQFTPTVAWQVNEQLSLGLGVSAVYGEAYIKRLQDLGSIIGIPRLINLIELNADGLTAAWDFGLLYSPTDRLTLGLTYLSEIEITFDGDLELFGDDPIIDPADRLPNTFGSGAGSSTFTFPRTIRFGIDYKITDEWSIGADLAWYDYSVFEAIVIDIEALDYTLGGSTLVIDETEVVEPKNSKDIYTFATGVTYNPANNWEFMAGVLYDESPYPDNTYTILSPDADKFGVSIGANYTFDVGIQVAMSYTRLVYEDRVVTNSILPTPANGRVLGKFTNIFGIQLAYIFGGERG